MSRRYTICHKTEVVKNTLDPVWQAFKIPVRALCNGDYDRYSRTHKGMHECLPLNGENINIHNRNRNIGEHIFKQSQAKTCLDLFVFLLRHRWRNSGLITLFKIIIWLITHVYANIPFCVSNSVLV